MENDKVFKFRGKTLEELQAMELNDFIALLPANQRRKFARGLTPEEEKLMEKILSGKNNIKTHIRDLVVIPQMVGKKISIYNGKEFVQVTIIEEMLGMRLGELAPTRKIAQHPDSKK
jgi:small subunit ribosomal protein S19